MRQSSQFKIESIYGKEILNHAHEVANFRIKYFRDFPYLYQGNLEYEKAYLEGYSADEKSILVKVKDENGRLLAVSTALPLITPSDILTDASDMFRNSGHQPQEIYYYGEIILDYSLRGTGFTRKIYEIQDDYARKAGFCKIAIATVVRDDDDPRRPTDYVSSDLVWQNLGFKKTSMTFNYHWPTLSHNGSVEEIQNPMIYWIKCL